MYISHYCTHILFQLNYYSREATFSSEKLVFNKTNFAAANVVSCARVEDLVQIDADA